MKISVAQRIGLSGLAVAIATFTHQPAMRAEVRSPIARAATQQIFNRSAGLSTDLMLDSAAIATPEATLAQSVALSSGTFVDGSGHETSGGARIVEEDGQRYLEFDESFSSDAGPDLVVLLHEEAVPESYSGDNYVNLGQIQRTVGPQRYAIPADVDIQAFQSAVIWCREFNVTFGYATL